MITTAGADRILYLGLTTIVLSLVTGAVLMGSGGTHTDPRELGFGIEAAAILLLHLWLLMSLGSIIVRRYAPRVLGFLTAVMLPLLVFIDVHDWIRAYR